MRFRAEQRFAAAPAEVMAAYLDPDLFAALADLDPVRAVEVIGIERNGTAAMSRVRYRFTADLPGPVTALVDPSRLTWVQESHFDLTTGVERLTIRPDHYPTLLEAAASVSYEAADAGATRRVLSGDLAVKGAPFFVRGKVEKVIVDGLSDHLGQEAAVVARHLG